MNEPIEDAIRVRSSALDDPECPAQGLGWQIVPFPEIAVKLIERDSPVSRRDIVEGFPNRGNIVVQCLRLRMQPSPFIESFFRRQVDPVGIELVREKAVELAKFSVSISRHD